jgi:small subunit ribosomal protein S10
MARMASVRDVNQQSLVDEAGGPKTSRAFEKLEELTPHERQLLGLPSKPPCVPLPYPVFLCVNTQYHSDIWPHRKPDVKLTPEQQELLGRTRIPKNLQTMYLRPLKRTPTHNIPVCSLQIRSFSVRNLELYADFAMRAAYYLGLPAKGPIPLPHITQRWTVPRSNFVHKKSQETFERVTVRRTIQILDGDAQAVQCWLGYLQQKAYHGIGMKAHMWEHEALGVGARMDEMAGDASAGLEGEWGNFGTRLNVKTAEAVEEVLGSEAFTEPKRAREAFWRAPVEILRKKLSSS